MGKPLKTQFSKMGHQELFPHSTLSLQFQSLPARARWHLAGGCGHQVAWPSKVQVGNKAHVGLCVGIKFYLPTSIKLSHKVLRGLKFFPTKEKEGKCA
jgi:hypothetical protein